MTAVGDAPQVDLVELSAFLLGQDDVVAAYLFGSLARGQANRLSDVDIAVLFASEPDTGRVIERQLALMEASGRFADREVQVIPLNRAPPLLAYEVIRDGWLLCERDPLARITFEVRTMKYYFDVKPMIDFYDEQLAKRIREVGLGASRQRHQGTLGAAKRIRERLAGAARG